LEIIAGNPDPEYGPCLLNVDKIGAGTHEVTPIIEEGRATVVILDPSGDVIFKRTLDEPHATIQPDEQGSVRLAPGDHSVECIFPDGTRTATLLVAPARPDYQEGRTN
jgi:hypothetical protein